MLWVCHLDTRAVNYQLYKIAPDLWNGTPQGCEQMVDPKLPHKTLLLRTQNKPTLENWLEDLPMFDRPAMEKWSSLKNLLARAKKAVAQHQGLNQLIDLAAPLGRVVISVIKPGGIVAWHSDLGPYAKKHLRFHVPLVTNPSATLYVGNSQQHVPIGALVAFDATVPHSAVNWGDHPRAHLIFEQRKFKKGEDDEAAA